MFKSSCCPRLLPVGLLLFLFFFAFSYLKKEPYCYQTVNSGFRCPFPLSVLIAVPTGSTSPTAFCVAEINDGNNTGVVFSLQQSNDPAILDASVIGVGGTTAYLQVNGFSYYVTLNVQVPGPVPAGGFQINFRNPILIESCRALDYPFAQ